MTKQFDFTIIDLVATVFGCINPFAYCFFGKLATESFKEMCDRLYECDWVQFLIDAKETICLRSWTHNNQFITMNSTWLFILRFKQYILNHLFYFSWSEKFIIFIQSWNLFLNDRMEKYIETSRYYRSIHYVLRLAEGVFYYQISK